MYVHIIKDDEGEAMAKIGRWKSVAARAAYMAAYESLKELWPVETSALDVPTTYGPTRVYRSGAGSATPIVLLHPLGGNGLCWYPIIEQLTRDRVVYTLDTIGAPGLSEQTEPITTATDYGIWLDDVLAELRLDRAHVLGYSEGAWRGAMAGVHGSARIASLTLVEPGAGLVKPTLGFLLKVMCYGIRPTDKNMRKASEWLTPGLEVSAQELACAKTSLGYRTRTPWPQPLKDEELQAIDAPTLVIFGAESVVTDVERARERVAAHVRRSEFEVFPGIGHGVLYQSPHREQVLARVDAFVRQHDIETSAAASGL
ncbi:alpha/beta fold hydrolase [Nocardia sp. NPDC088792]|uniref:alpha/beta fold hydrolase n=1 Tax=Nocardia sp. NPDC088792 TaxID=3364332 RepID=UPI0037F88D0A